MSVGLCYLHSSGTPGTNMTSQKREKFSSTWKKHVPKCPKETLQRQYKQHWNWIVLNSMPKQRPLYHYTCCQPLSCTNAFFVGKARSSTGERRSLQRIKSHSLEAWHVELWTLTAFPSSSSSGCLQSHTAAPCLYSGEDARQCCAVEHHSPRPAAAPPCGHRGEAATRTSIFQKCCDSRRGKENKEQSLFSEQI